MDKTKYTFRNWLFVGAALLVFGLGGWLWLSSRPLTLQGELLNQAGQELPDGMYDMRVRVFDLLDSSVVLYEKAEQVEVKNGQFSVSVKPPDEVLQTPSAAFVCLDNLADVPSGQTTPQVCQSPGNNSGGAVVCSPYYIEEHVRDWNNVLMGHNNLRQLPATAGCEDNPKATVGENIAVDSLVAQGGVSQQEVQQIKEELAAQPLALGLVIDGTDLALQNGDQTVALVDLSGIAPIIQRITLPGTSGSDSQTLSISGNTVTISGGNSISLPADTDTNTLYTAGSGLQLVGTTFSRNAGTANGQIEIWNGSSWATVDGGANGQVLTMVGGVPTWVAATSGETDGVIGNEVVGPTGSNSGLVLSGAGTSIDPLTLAVSAGNGLSIVGNLLRINSPTCAAANEELNWSGTAFICGTDADTTYTAGTGLSLAGTTFSNTGVLSVSVTGPIQSSGGQSPTLSCPTCLVNGGSVLTINGTTAGTAAQVLNGGDTLILAAGSNLTTIAGATDTVTIGTVSNPTFSGAVTAGSVSTNTINPSTTLTVAGALSATGNASVGGNLTLNGALMPGGSAGTSGQLLVSQGSGVPAQWQTIDFNAIADARISLQKGVANGLATLGADGKVPTSQLPAIAITDTYVRDDLNGAGDSCTDISPVATQGDVCVTTTDSKTWILAADPGSTAGNWVELATPGAPITSVNAQIGNVVLTGSNGLAVASNTDFELGGTLEHATTIAQAGFNLAFTGTGNVGIGVASPGQKLDVAGNLQFSGALMPNSLAGTAGQVLLSQGAGTAPLWSDVSSLNVGAVVNATASQGLVRAGSGTTLDPYTLGLQTCTNGQVLASTGSAWACSTPTTYAAGTGLNLVGSTFNLANTAVSPGTYGSGSTFPIITIDQQGRITSASNGTLPSYSAGTGISLAGSTFSNTGVLTVAGSGPVTSTGGQNPTISFADGASPGQFWQWDGDSWELATSAVDGDSVTGNEVTNVTGSNSGLVRSGAGSSGNPYTLAINSSNGLQIVSGALQISSPTCAGTTKLQWTGTAFACSADVDTGITSLNGLTVLTQTLAVGTSGLDFNISSSGSTHTFNMPSASGTARGVVTTSAQTFAGVKTFTEGLSVSNCGLSTNVYCLNGNSFGSSAVLGTNDAFGLDFETNNAVRLSIDTSGNVFIGTADSTGALLTLDTKNTAGDPAGVNGSMYYNSSTNKFRCFENSAWVDCIGSGTTSVKYVAADTAPMTFTNPSSTISLPDLDITVPAGKTLRATYSLKIALSSDLGYAPGFGFPAFVKASATLNGTYAKCDVDQTRLLTNDRVDYDPLNTSTATGGRVGGNGEDQICNALATGSYIDITYTNSSASPVNWTIRLTQDINFLNPAQNLRVLKDSSVVYTIL